MLLEVEISWLMRIYTQSADWEYIDIWENFYIEDRSFLVDMLMKD